MYLAGLCFKLQVKSCFTILLVETSEKSGQRSLYQALLSQVLDTTYLMQHSDTKFCPRHKPV